MTRLWQWLWRRDHVPRLWPVALVDVDTCVVHHELGTFDVKLGRVRTRW